MTATLAKTKHATNYPNTLLLEEFERQRRQRMNDKILIHKGTQNITKANKYHLQLTDHSSIFCGGKAGLHFGYNRLRRKKWAGNSRSACYDIVMKTTGAIRYRNENDGWYIHSYDIVTKTTVGTAAIAIWIWYDIVMKTTVGSYYNIVMEWCCRWCGWWAVLWRYWNIRYIVHNIVMKDSVVPIW